MRNALEVSKCGASEGMMVNWTDLVRSEEV